MGYGFQIVMQLSFGRMIVLLGLPSFIFVFFASLILGAILVPLFRRFIPGQQVRDDGPKTHLIKSGTPTFGGIIFIIPILVFAIFSPIIKNPNSAQSANKISDCLFGFLNVKDAPISPLTAIAIFMLFVGVVGFIDDFVKIKINTKGLKPVVKSILLLIVIIVFTIYYLYFSGVEPYFLIPFTNLSMGGVPITLDNSLVKLGYGVLMSIVLYFTCNSVNITDGVDGLATSVTFISATILGIIGASLDSNMSRISSFLLFAIAGGCLAFLLFNRHPAKIFMGDTGSLALGAGIGASAVIMGVFWILIPVGIVYVLESLSVVIQVTHFKRTKERVFRMAPLHHHFELGGWSEWKVVSVFSVIGIIGGLLGLWMVR